MFLIEITIVLTFFTLKSDCIVNGNDTNIERHPYMVTLCNSCQTESDDLGNFKRSDDCCAGTILSPIWILTSSHCHGQTVRYGRTNILNCSEELLRLPEETHHIYAAVNRTGVPHLLLVKLSQPILLGDNAEPIRLPAANSEITAKQALIIGFGSRPPKPDTPVLQELLIDVCDAACCSITMKDTVEWFHTCVKSDETNLPGGVCDGDTGTPMVIHDTRRNPVQVGVSVWMYQANDSLRCQAPHHTSGYIRTDLYIGEIEKITEMRRNTEGYLERLPKAKRIEQIGKIAMVKGSFQIFPIKH